MRFERGALGRALLLAYLFRVLGAMLLALPLAIGVGASGLLDFPHADAKLFERGGLYLLEVLSTERALLAGLLVPGGLLLMVMALAGVVPEWIVLRALPPRSSEIPPTQSPTLRAAGRSLGRLALLAIGTWMARALLVLTTLGLAMAARSFFVTASDERLPFLAASVAVFVGVLGWVCLSVLHDVAAIDITRAELPLARALPTAVVALHRKGLRLGALYTAAALAFLALLGVSAALVAQVDVARGEGWRTGVVAFVHQLVIGAQLVLRAAWLSSAMAMLAPERRPEPDAQADAFL
jgi:hypothetical protein